MSNPLLSSYSSCFVFTKHPVQLKTVTTNVFKICSFRKRHLNKRAGVWTPLHPPLNCSAYYAGSVNKQASKPASVESSADALAVVAEYVTISRIVLLELCNFSPSPDIRQRLSVDSGLLCEETSTRRHRQQWWMGEKQSVEPTSWSWLMNVAIVNIQYAASEMN